MAFAGNVNKPLWLSFGSYPISVERRGEYTTLIGYEPALTALGTGRGDRPALGAGGSVRVFPCKKTTQRHCVL